MAVQESEIYESQIEVFKCVRYIYPEGVIPIKDFAPRQGENPGDVEPVNGAIGFDFVSLIYFDFEDRRLRHIVGEAETYYWGQELSRDELADLPGTDFVLERISTERFLLGSWGGIVPLKDFEHGITPNLIQAPSS